MVVTEGSKFKIQETDFIFTQPFWDRYLQTSHAFRQLSPLIRFAYRVLIDVSYPFCAILYSD